MADIKPTAQSLLNGITNDVKGRSLLDNSDGGDLAGQFSEVMLSRMANLGISDSDMKAYLKKIHQRAAADQSVVDRTTNAQATRDAKAVKETGSAEKANPLDDGKLATKEKIETLIRELAQKNDAPVEDTKALKALKKVAEFLVKAATEGKIELPPEMTAKLEAFLAKNDAFSAYDMSVFMRDFIDAFRDMKIVMPQANANVEASAGLKWPEEIVAAFEDLGLKAAAGSLDKPLTIVDVMRAVKALVNESEKAAHLTINNKLKDVVLPQDQMAALGVAAGETLELPVVDTNVSVDIKSENKTAEQAATVLVQTAVTQKDIETSLSVDNNDIAKKIAEENAAAAAIINPLAAKPHAADKAKEQSKVWASELPASFVAMTETRDAAKEKTPSLTNLAMNAAFPNRNAREADPKASSATGSAESSQLKQAVVANVAASAPAPADLSAKIVDKGLDQLGANVAIGGVDNLSAASVKNAARTAPAQTILQQPSAATQQVMAQISQKANKTTEISVQLTPAELGRVEVRLSIQRDGSVHAIVMADKPETLALLQKDASQLERSLQQAGLNANSENMSFNLRDQQAQQFGQSRNRFSRAKITDDKVADIAMNVMPETSIITDNRVNYHA